MTRPNNVLQASLLAMALRGREPSSLLLLSVFLIEGHNKCNKIDKMLKMQELFSLFLIVSDDGDDNNNEYETEIGNNNRRDIYVLQQPLNRH